MTDIHCHILPNIDDGAKDINESLAMCKIAKKDGISVIVATPHIIPGLYQSKKELILSKVNELNNILENRNWKIEHNDSTNPKILPGAENRVHPDLIDSMKNGKALTINDNMRYIMLDLPHWFIFPYIKELIVHLKEQGIISIISHPERNTQIRRNIDILYKLVNAGALSQITAMSITGEFGYNVKRFSKKLLSKNLVHIIASDAHSVCKRPPILSRAVEAAARIVGSNQALNMVTTIPQAIVEGKGIPH